jgi:hypothetical protein
VVRVGPFSSAHQIEASMTERTVVFHLPTMVSGSLAAISGTVAGRTYPLTAGTFVIGRQAELDLSLPTEPGVSKVHAKIVAEGDHYMLYDAESRNGTVVNGRPVQRVRLYDGDEIQICGCTLRFTQTAGGGVHVKNPPSIDERMSIGDLPTRGSSEAVLSRRDTGAVNLDISQSGMGSSTGAPLSPVATEAFPSRQTPSSMEPTSLTLPPQAIPRRSPAPWFVIGMLVSMLGGGGVYAMYLMNDDGAARLARTNPQPTTTTPSNDDSPSGDRVAAASDQPAQTGEPGADSSLSGPAANPLPVDTGGAPTEQHATGEAAAEPASVGSVASSTPEPDVQPTLDPVVEQDAPDPVSARPKVAKKKDRPKPIEKDAPEEQVVAAETTSPVVSKPAEPAATEEVASSEPDVLAAAVASVVGGGWVPAQIVPAAKAPVRVASGGRVRSVDAAEGDIVVEGDTLVTFDQAVDAADMATLRESIRALEAIVESGGSSEAEVMLRQEQDRLTRLEAGQQQGRVSAPASGTLSGFTPKVGEKLRARQVIGTIVGANSKTVTATLEKNDGAKVKKGSKVRVRSTTRGELDGVVTSTKKKGTKFAITVDVVGADAADVDAVRVP